MNRTDSDTERRSCATRNANDSQNSCSMPSRNNNDRLEPRSGPRSLLRDRPLAEPRQHRHRHMPLVTMNGNTRTQQQKPLSPNTQPHTAYNNRSPSPPSFPPSPTSAPSSPFLPSIDEGSSNSEFDYRHGNKKISPSHSHSHNYYQKKAGSSATLASYQVPSLSAASDNSSVDSFMENDSHHSTDSSKSSDSSVDIDFEYDDVHDDDFSNDNDISISMRSTQSMPPALTVMSRTTVSRTKSSNTSRSSTRRRPSLPAKQQQHLYARTLSSSASHSSHVSLPSRSTTEQQQKFDPSSVRRMYIPPPPFTKQARRQSYPPFSEQPYTKTSKNNNKGSPSNTECLSVNRRQCMVKFLFSGVCLQLILLLAISVLVVCSRSQAAITTETLLHLREFESMSLLKLHRLESHSMHVHELMRNRMVKNKETDDLEDYMVESGEYDSENGKVIDPENDPLMDQYKQLAKMSLDLRKHADVTALQHSIQDTAIDEIISVYGEGPVKVVVELDFGDKNAFIAHNNKHQPRAQAQSARHTHNMIKGTYISIILWPDTPHAAWSWLEQIRRTVWDGSSIGFNPTSTLLQFQPTKDDPMDRGHLEFVEGHPSQEKSNPDMHHGAWTIGLRETIGGDNDNNKKGTLEMFINLSDNQEARKHETCIGKIFDGFDALQRLLEGTAVAPNGEADTNVSVKSVSAMHLTHKELQQIYR